jgi:hypothetical protein
MDQGNIIDPRKDANNPVRITISVKKCDTGHNLFRAFFLTAKIGFNLGNKAADNHEFSRNITLIVYPGAAGFAGFPDAQPTPRYRRVTGR